MNSHVGIVERACSKIRANLNLIALLLLHTVVCCVSLAEVSRYQSYIPYNNSGLFTAAIIAVALSSISLLFAAARFSFGYFVGFYFYTLILGFLWIENFTIYPYKHVLAGVSAAASLLLFLLPALLMTRPLPRNFEISSRSLEYVLKSILVLAITTIVAASSYNFRFTSLEHIYEFRNELAFPAPIRYLIGIVLSVLLPFAFACYWALNRRWSAGATLLLMLLFYPITLSKFSFFAPAWIISLLVLSKIFEPRPTAVLSLFLPLLLGLFFVVPFPNKDMTPFYFNLVNIRMVATPSSAMDIYNHFFSTRPLTYFCQISFLKTLTHCPYQDPLSVVMEHTYGFGNINASLFATEGIASVGLIFAPLSALVCGLVIAFGNRLSAGLSPRFVLISGALLPQALLNVPLTTVLLTHGAAILFLLWYVTPRAIFRDSEEMEA
ncbi:hypothetical protein [Bradyrhizobium sp. dw_78]|uniref:hypothetical protein n=1 Tax=Bradyrhizobium sp. dw_78 TaxID=2719793 RepID=UPI001BD3A1E1|nr:hypothetical protein [Bradyrhizobium sp. dw_78]